MCVASSSVACAMSFSPWQSVGSILLPVSPGRRAVGGMLGCDTVVLFGMGSVLPEVREGLFGLYHFPV